MPPHQMSPQAAEDHHSEGQWHPNGKHIGSRALNHKQHNCGTDPTTCHYQPRRWRPTLRPNQNAEDKDGDNQADRVDRTSRSQNATEDHPSDYMLHRC